MRGLILKDFYNMKDNIASTVITAICIGLLLMIKGNPSMFVLAVTLAGGSIASTCVKMDETAKWEKYEITTPVSRKTIVLEKYVLMLILIIVSLIFGSAVSLAAALITNSLNIAQLFLYVAVGFSLAIVSGSLILFCIFKFGLIKSDIFITVCYLIPVGIFVGILVLLKFLGFDFMTGNIYRFLTFALPVISLLFGAAIAVINVAMYQKKQF